MDLDRLMCDVGLGRETAYEISFDWTIYVDSEKKSMRLEAFRCMCYINLIEVMYTVFGRILT